MAVIFELILELLVGLLKGFTQMFVTAMWQTEDPAITRQRNVCLSIYGIGAAIFLAGLGGLWLQLIGYLVFFLCVGSTLVLFVAAGQLADALEQEILQQETIARKNESDVGS